MLSSAVASQALSPRVSTANGDVRFTCLLSSITAALSDPSHHHPSCAERGRRVQQKGFAADSGGARSGAAKESRVFSFFVSFVCLRSKSWACRTNDSLPVHGGTGRSKKLFQELSLKLSGTCLAFRVCRYCQIVAAARGASGVCLGWSGGPT